MRKNRQTCARLATLEEVRQEVCAQIVLRSNDEWRERQALTEFKAWLDREIAGARKAMG